jgi:hypothetical protein
MATQTWALVVHISDSGRSYYSVRQDSYTPRGRALPHLIGIEDLEFGALHKVADAFADSVTNAALAEYAGQQPL